MNLASMILINVILAYITSISKHIESTSNGEFKPIYFISYAFTCKIYHFSNLFSIKSSGQM